MSVLIRGMSMPEDCPVCPLAHWNKLDSFTGCELIKRYFDKADMETEGRPSFCPLVELPAQHGRLIDADALMENAQYKGTHDIVTAWDIVAAQTVIEAEEGEG